MKAYMVKNKEGKYLRGIDFISYKPEFCEDIIDAALFETKDRAEWQVLGTGLKDYKIVSATICEGDLEEEIGILKGFAYKLFREKYDDIPEKRVREWFNDALKDTRNFIQQAKES